MGFMDKLRGELVDIIEWLADSRSTLAWRFPRYNNEIKNGAELIVREGQEAVFVYRGQLADRFGPGHYTLTSENLPIMSTLQGWKHGFNSPFRSEVYFINTRPVTDLRWGTANPVTVRDPDFKMVQVRANGLCVVRVVDAGIFLRQIIGTDSSVDVEEISELLRRVITLAFSDMIMETRLGVIDLQGRQVQLAEQLRAFVAERVDDEYGLAIDSITLNISLPEEITQAMTRGVARGVEESGWVNNLGDMQRYQQAKAAEAMSNAAANPGGSGMMGDMLGAQMGMLLGQQLGQQMQPGPAQQYAQPGAFPAYQGAQGYPQGGPSAPPPLPTQVSYHVDQNGQAAGPFQLQQLQHGIAAGQVTASTLVWAQGMAGWTPAGQVPELARLFAEPPPLPTTPPPPPSASKASGPGESGPGEFGPGEFGPGESGSGS